MVTLKYLFKSLRKTVNNSPAVFIMYVLIVSMAEIGSDGRDVEPGGDESRGMLNKQDFSKKNSFYSIQRG